MMIGLDRYSAAGRLPRCSWRHAFMATLALLTAACDYTPKPDPQADIRRLEEQLAARDRKLLEQKAAIDELNRQLAVARGLTAEDLQLIFYPERIVIDPLTAGASFDGQPGDDGVVVYIRPLDRVGDVVKVAGDLTIQLFDLSAPPDENLVGECHVPAAEISRLWYGKMLTQHYTVRCPWRAGPPRNPEITVRAVFVDFLTRRSLTAQATCRISLAP